MYQDKLREANTRLVVEKALECFLEQGIEKTRVSEVAQRAGLTERSVFRYFKTKSDLVLAASYLYWNRVTAYIEGQLPPDGDKTQTGLEDVAQLLVCYSNLYSEHREGILFTLDAELVLNAAGKKHEIKNRPPEPYESSNGPVARAIRKGLADGSIDPRVDVRVLYYNSYDAILGVMQRMSIGGTPSAGELDYRSRMRHLCEMFVSAFRGDI
ncbi:MAG: TetR/AcrR family transcriptional regulator [Oscillospiraceae bacterium]|nr:TetR/AcrR family transcriptional regulator [Oscillospiraceae bacterium]